MALCLSRLQAQVISKKQRKNRLITSKGDTEVCYARGEMDKTSIEDGWTDYDYVVNLGNNSGIYGFVMDPNQRKCDLQD